MTPKLKLGLLMIEGGYFLPHTKQVVWTASLYSNSATSMEQYASVMETYRDASAGATPHNREGSPFAPPPGRVVSTARARMGLTQPGVACLHSGWEQPPTWPQHPAVPAGCARGGLCGGRRASARRCGVLFLESI